MRTKQKLPLSERGYNIALTITNFVFGVLFFALAVFLFIESAHCYSDKDSFIGVFLLVFGIIVLIVSVFLFFLCFVKSGEKGRLRNINSTLNKFIE